MLLMVWVHWSDQACRLQVPEAEEHSDFPEAELPPAEDELTPAASDEGSAAVLDSSDEQKGADSLDCAQTSDEASNVVTEQQESAAPEATGKLPAADTSLSPTPSSAHTGEHLHQLCIMPAAASCNAKRRLKRRWLMPVCVASALISTSR